MNTILLTAFLGIVLMMIGAFSKSKTLPRFVAIGGIIVILIANMVELLSQESFFTFNVKNMLTFNSFNLAFIGVALLCTLIYFLKLTEMVLVDTRLDYLLLFCPSYYFYKNF